MDDLGNEAIKTGVGRIAIRNPNAAETLLALALENTRRPRRVIFFCSCQWPQWGHGRHCHRVTVGSLLLKAARRRNTPIAIVEWPGGTPQEVELQLSLDVVRKSRKATTVRLGKFLPTPDLLGLPWGSLVRVGDPEYPSSCFVGPAQFSGGTWALPKLADGLEKDENVGRGIEAGREWHERWGFAERVSH
jgi:hypothetical protein